MTAPENAAASRHAMRPRACGAAPRGRSGPWSARGLGTLRAAVRAAIVGVALGATTTAASAQPSAPTGTPGAPTTAASPGPGGPVPLAPMQVMVPSVPTVAVASPSAEGVADVVVVRSREVVDAALASMGYALSDRAMVAAAQQRLGGAPRPDPATLFRVALLAGGDRSLHLHLSVEGDAYVGELLVASVDGTGPYRQTVRGGPSEFLGALDAAVRALVPAPAAFDAASALRYRHAAATALAAPPAPGPAFVPPTAPARPRGRRFGGTLALGVSAGSYEGGQFRHVPVALRFDVHLNDKIVLGLYGAYVNLDLDNTRGSNLLGLVQIEDRLRFLATGRVQFPLRAALGYMPRNGPVLRLAAGLRVPIRNGYELGADLFAPTVYFLPGVRRFGYDASLELTKRFGPSMR